MKLLFFHLLAALAVVLSLPRYAAAQPQQPLYIVNGEVRGEIASIPPEVIERVELLDADEESIARYGEAAQHGVMLVTLRYDTPACFAEDGTTFGEYIARTVTWGDDEPAARVALRYRVTAAGRAEVTRELESTDKRLKRRVLKAVAEAPAWRAPALKNGEPVEVEEVLIVQLPSGKPMPREPYLIIR